MTKFGKFAVLKNAVKQKHQAEKVLAHIPNCPRCTILFRQFNECPTIKALPQSAVRQANEHIMKAQCCAKIMAQILLCPKLKDELK
jgi:hypothetical protein